MNDRVLITFAGSHDLKPNNRGAIEQLIEYLKPKFVYIFLTKDYCNKFGECDLHAHYSGMVDGELEVIETDIENPTDFAEIASKISSKIDEINTFVKDNKNQAYLNLTSGTPAIISVLSLLAITGQIERAEGVYAPDPTKDTTIKRNTLDFYKDSVAYKTVKSLINSMDYVGLSNFLGTKNNFKKLQDDKDFISAVEFSRERVLCNFEEAEKHYQSTDLLRGLEYKTPTDKFYEAIECFMTAQVAQRHGDMLQTVLKLAIVREMILSYILYGTKDALISDLIELRPRSKNNNSLAPYLKEEVLNAKYSDLRVCIEEQLSLDVNRDLTSRLENLILNFMADKLENPILKRIKSELFKLEQMVTTRNGIAHAGILNTYNPKWAKSVELIIKLTAEYLGYSEPEFDAYTNLNKILLKRLKQVVNA